MKRKITSLLLAAVLFFYVNIGMAAPKAKYDKNYDFKQIKKIIVLEPLFITNTASEKTEENLAQLLNEHAKLKRVKIVTVEDVQLEIQVQKGIAFDVLEQENPEEAKRLLLEYLPEYVDAAIYTTVRRFDEGSVYVETSTYTETKYEKYQAYDSKGNLKTYEYPVTHTYTVPAHYKSTFSVRIDFRLVDLATNNDVLWQSDYRYREYIDKNSAINMYKRVLRRFFEQLQKRF